MWASKEGAMLSRPVSSFLTIVVLAGCLSGAAAGRDSSPAAEDQRVPLTRIYRGEDGSALYLRQLGSTVYGFGEHPGLKYAYVLTGAVTNDLIVGKWWDVPKGNLRRVSRGTLRLQFSQAGARIVRTGGADLGPDVFTAIPPDGIPWPNMQVAGFQATKTNDLDGVFVGDDASRHYVREVGADTVWVAERPAQPGERPGWATVFIGKRSASGTFFAGTYVDVPKGVELRSGNFAAAFVGSKRELELEQQSVERTKTLAPDYALNLDRFDATVANALNNHVVGYAYAIAYNGAIVRSQAWGVRRHAVDGAALPFTAKTQAQTASTAKLVSATAIVKALLARGLDVDTKVAPFLPSCMQKGPGISTLSFRELLNHRNGLLGGRYGPRYRARIPEDCNGQDPFECLLEVVAKGRILPLRYAYNNKAYDLLRFLVPLVVDTSATKADFAHFKCQNKAGVLHRRIADRFARYVRYEVLRPVGSDGTWYPSGDYSLNYNCEPGLQGANCHPSRKGEAMTPEYFLRSGSGKMAMSALDYVRFLSALERGLILPKAVVESMKQGRLGFDTFISGKAGPYFWKNGGCPSLEKPQWGRGCQTLAIVFPGNVQAYLAINSANNTYSPSRDAVFRNAFDAALK